MYLTFHQNCLLEFMEKVQETANGQEECDYNSFINTITGRQILNCNN